MAARWPFWKWCHWKSIGFCLWTPSTCIWDLKLKFESKLDLCSGNHVVYRQTYGRTRWIQYTPPPSYFVGQGYKYWNLINLKIWLKKKTNIIKIEKKTYEQISRSSLCTKFQTYHLKIEDRFNNEVVKLKKNGQNSNFGMLWEFKYMTHLMPAHILIWREF